MQRFLIAVTVAIFLSGCEYSLRPTDGSNPLNEAMGDVVDREDGAAITVDGNSYLVARVRRTFTDDNPSSQYYGDRRTIYYDEINVRGTSIPCYAGQDCAVRVRDELARQQAVRIPVDDGDDM